MSIILVSADFSKELTTAVMWLNEHDLDIRCVRIKPYSNNGRTLIDVQQMIPLPEAIDYQIQIREKEQKVRQDKSSDGDGRRRSFWESLLTRAEGKTALHALTGGLAKQWLTSVHSTLFTQQGTKLRRHSVG